MARRTIRHETTTDAGTAFRFRLEPLDDGRVRVLEWARRRPHWSTFRRDPRQVGQVYTRDELRLPAEANA